MAKKVFELADTFAYHVPSLYKRQPFTFDITIKDLEKLIDTLDFIITGIFETDVDITSNSTLKQPAYLRMPSTMNSCR